MTALQLKAELNRQINSIADDEAMLAKAINYIKRLAKQKAKTEDPTRMSKEDFFKMIDESKKEYEEGKFKSMLPNETLEEFLNRVKADVQH